MSYPGGGTRLFRFPRACFKRLCNVQCTILNMFLLMAAMAAAAAAATLSLPNAKKTPGQQQQQTANSDLGFWAPRTINWKWRTELRREQPTSENQSANPAEPPPPQSLLLPPPPASKHRILFVSRIPSRTPQALPAQHPHAHIAPAAALGIGQVAAPLRRRTALVHC